MGMTDSGTGFQEVTDSSSLEPPKMGLDKAKAPVVEPDKG